MSDWIAFSARMPTSADANQIGCIEVKERGGLTRISMWNWVQFVSLWHSNGFVSWRPTAYGDTRPAGTLTEQEPRS